MDVCPIVSFHQLHDQLMKVINIHHEIQDMDHGCAWPSWEDEQTQGSTVDSLTGQDASARSPKGKAANAEALTQS